MELRRGGQPPRQHPQERHRSGPKYFEPHDELNRLTDLLHERATAGGSTTARAPIELSRFHYTVRDDGKRTGLNEGMANNTAATPGALPVTTRGVSYGYDDAGRLTGELGTDGRGVSYRGDWGLDNVGNRTASTYQFATAAAPGTFSSSSSIAATFNANDWLTGQTTNNGGATGTQSWSYDQNGAELTQGYGTSAPQENGWGFDGRLLGTGTQGTTTGGTGYETDASGNRVSVTLHQGKPEQKTTKYLLDENTGYASVLEERAPDTNDSGASVLQARYVWGGGRAPLAMWRKGADGQFRLSYFLTDGQESVRQLSDGQGTVTDSYFYDAWGNPLAGGSGTTVNPFRYTGQMLDASGKYFLRARYYDPGTGRFLSHDPVMGSNSDPVSLHRYLYAGDDSVNGVDPSGRETLVESLQSLWIQANMVAMGAAPVPAIFVQTSQMLVVLQVAAAIVNPAAREAFVEGWLMNGFAGAEAAAGKETLALFSESAEVTAGEVKYVVGAAEAAVAPLEAKVAANHFLDGQIGQSVRDLDPSLYSEQELEQILLGRGFTERDEGFVTLNGQLTTARQRFWTHEDGGMVRLKPQGDPIDLEGTANYRGYAYASKSVQRRGIEDGHLDFGNELFKVDTQNRPVPKSAGHFANPGIADPYLKSVHIGLRSP